MPQNRGPYFWGTRAHIVGRWILSVNFSHQPAKWGGLSAIRNASFVRTGAWTIAEAAGRFLFAPSDSFSRPY